MAFLKYASAQIEKKNIDVSLWNTHTSHFGSKTASSPDLSKYTTDKYLLTHATIMASVDTEDAGKGKLGKVVENGKTINRAIPNYYITPETSQYVNDNNDAWERKLLLATYHTFRGAENYLEHIQIPELSRGKIIDAVARDIGSSVYIDILVATDRKHTSLIRDIEQERISTLSMGCSIAYSICSKCGNKSADETDLCEHIRFEKGNTFFDENGKKRVIAELCGSVDNPGSVTFIEASWVGNPAFKGAVVRNLLNSGVELTEKESSDIENKLREAHLIAAARETLSIDDFLKTAARPPKLSWGDDDDEVEEETEEKGFVEDISEDIKKHIRDRVKNDLKKELQKELLGDETPEHKGLPENESNQDNIIYSSYDQTIEHFQAFSKKYASALKNDALVREVFLILHTSSKHGWSKARSASSNNSSIMTAIYLHDRDRTKNPLPSHLYTTLIKVGGTCNYASPQAFLRTCELVLNRKLTNVEAATLIKRGKLLH